MAWFSKVDEVSGSKSLHVLAFVRAASPLTQRFVEIGSMFAGRDPDFCATIFGVKGGRASNLAHIADSVFMGCSVPVDRLPRGRREVTAGCANENRHMLGIERVTMTSTISPPEMVVVNLGSWRIVGGDLRWKDLPVDGAVLRLHLWRLHVWSELGWDVRAILPPDHKCRGELYEKSLFQFVAHPVMVGV